MKGSNSGLLPVTAFVLGIVALTSCGGGGVAGGATGATSGSSTSTSGTSGGTSGGGSSGSTNGTTTGGTTTGGSSGGSTGGTTGGTSGGSGGIPDLGPGANMNGYRPFPDDNPWNTPIDQDPVDPISDNIIASIGAAKAFHPDFGANWNGGPFGIPYIVVSGNQPRVPMSFYYPDESDPGPYPFPPSAPIEGGPNASGDRHVLVIDRDNLKLYETFDSWPQNGGTSWDCGSGAIFDLTSNAMRPEGWTSADAAGLPIFPGLVRYDEVVLQGEINHALRFTVSRTRRNYLYPARHFASSYTNVNYPPMGMRVRLKASFDISSYPPHAQVILRALKKYGMIVADNGSDWYVSGAPDARWDDEELNTLKQLRGNNFEVVKMGPLGP